MENNFKVGQKVKVVKIIKGKNDSDNSVKLMQKFLGEKSKIEKIGDYTPGITLTISGQTNIFYEEELEKVDTNYTYGQLIEKIKSNEI